VRPEHSGHTPRVRIAIDREGGGYRHSGPRHDCITAGPPDAELIDVLPPEPELKTTGPVSNDRLKPIGPVPDDDDDDELKPIGPVDELKPIGPVDVDELKPIGAPDEDEDDVELKPIGPVDEPEVMVVPTVPVSMTAPLPSAAVVPSVPAPTPSPSWSVPKFAPVTETASSGRAELT